MSQLEKEEAAFKEVDDFNAETDELFVPSLNVMIGKRVPTVLEFCCELDSRLCSVEAAASTVVFSTAVTGVREMEFTR